MHLPGAVGPATGAGGAGGARGAEAKATAAAEERTGIKTPTNEADFASMLANSQQMLLLLLTIVVVVVVVVLVVTARPRASARDTRLHLSHAAMKEAHILSCKLCKNA